jgi:hypothetical protein
LAVVEKKLSPTASVGQCCRDRRGSTGAASGGLWRSMRAAPPKGAWGLGPERSRQRGTVAPDGRPTYMGGQRIGASAATEQRRAGESVDDESRGRRRMA